jgi:ATP synthase protein I
MNDYDKLRHRIELQVKRMKKSERDRPSLMAQTVYLGTLGLLFIAPVAGGTYLGLWLDERQSGYSVHWTILGMLLGIMVGAVNVYLFVRTRG